MSQWLTSYILWALLRLAMHHNTAKSVNFIKALPNNLTSRYIRALLCGNLFTVTSSITLYLYETYKLSRRQYRSEMSAVVIYIYGNCPRQLDIGSIYSGIVCVFSTSRKLICRHVCRKPLHNMTVILIQTQLLYVLRLQDSFCFKCVTCLKTPFHIVYVSVHDECDILNKYIYTRIMYQPTYLYKNNSCHKKVLAIYRVPIQVRFVLCTNNSPFIRRWI